MTQSTFSSSMTSKAVPLVEKRKKTMFSKEAGEAKGENKRKKPNGSFINSEEKRTDLSQVKKGKEAKSNHYEQAPTGYVHVRARRGQATDSHSLAERARREKIRERLQFLQSLVPGCDQVTGKAQILDEIIKYVQSLQYQVECLAAKLASLNSTLIDFEVDPQAPYQWKCCLEPSLSASLVLKEDQRSALVFQDDAVLFSSQDYQNQNNIPLQYLHNSYVDF